MKTKVLISCTATAYAKKRFSHDVAHVCILSVNEKLPVSKFRYFGKYIIQLDDYFCVHVSCQRQTGFEKNTSFTSPRTMVHAIHVLSVLFAGIENLIASFSSDKC